MPPHTIPSICFGDTVLKFRLFNKKSVQTGIFARRITRAPKDIRGATFPVEFKLVDNSESPEALSAAAAANGSVGVEFKKPAAPYAVKVLLTVCLFPTHFILIRL